MGGTRQLTNQRKSNIICCYQATNLRVDKFDFVCKVCGNVYDSLGGRWTWKPRFNTLEEKE